MHVYKSSFYPMGIYTPGKKTRIEKFLEKVKNTRAVKAAKRNAKAVEKLGMQRLAIGIAMSVDTDLHI